MEATARIAAGDLDSQVPVRANDYAESMSLGRSINEMAQTLKDGRSRERQLLLSVSHELRTPLTSIRGFAEAITDGAVEDTTRAAEVIIAESRRLERLVGDLLDLTKLESRQMSIAAPTIRCGRSRAHHSGRLPAPCREEWLASCGRGAVRGHAADAGRPRSAGADSGQSHRECAHIRPLPRERGPARRRHRRHPRRRSSRSRTMARASHRPIWRGSSNASTRRIRPNRQFGSGLGLAIVAELASAMGATVRAESPIYPTGGSRFTVTLGTHEPAR